uniref:Uncharacterized protein n=1 Tax=Candidatus Kentrum sp. UNK TaxID=2126344 RepID=A0A451AKQ4_9GAMM|nr:MAG: hypothetical protein BECKUNK1418G_GA0071005_11006 [Candidatus Kentron sp. UNK]VFK72099.1 MAG: hypothetical protein BECKUNK1418H_GA0071006_10966 [Candidatus Kentron sp. UNK]
MMASSGSGCRIGPGSVSLCLSRVTTEIRIQDIRALIGAPGPEETDWFLTAISRDGFDTSGDYTEWRRHGLPEMGIDELAEAANCLAQERNRQMR